MDGKSEWHVWYSEWAVRRNHKLGDAFWLLRLVHLATDLCAVITVWFLCSIGRIFSMAFSPEFDGIN